jgi:hypothetical protein
VSMTAARSSLVTTRGGRQEPTPVMRALVKCPSRSATPGG